MKLITLNTWGGRAGKEKLLSFFKEQKDEIDIFCLQEMWSAAYKDTVDAIAGGIPIKYEHVLTTGVQDISSIAHEHVSYFRPQCLDNYGLLTLIKNNIAVNSEGDIFVYRHRGYMPSGDRGTHARNIQYVTFELNGRLVTVVNFHGLWNGKGKTDSEDRIQQSKNIVSFVQTLSSDVVFAGDLNLLPDTQSIKLFEDIGLLNLIKENNITSTRTSFYTKPDKYADYIFVSKGIKVNEFKVLPEEVSDHSALFLDFE